MLLQRGERHASGAEGRSPRELTPYQILLAASDASRQGALRFRTEQDGPFLAEEGRIPKSLDIAALLAAADDAVAEPISGDWKAFEQLLGAGSSALGGARPKAAVVDDDGALWLAKFPQLGDGTNVPVWEMTALDVAERAGLQAPPRQLLTVAGRQVLLAPAPC